MAITDHGNAASERLTPLCYAGARGATRFAPSSGLTPQRKPPQPASVKRARDIVAAALGITPQEADACHHAGKWRYNVVAEVQRRCDNPDTVLRKWLQQGSPIGVLETVVPGKLFPEFDSPAEAEYSAITDEFWTRAATFGSIQLSTGSRTHQGSKCSMVTIGRLRREIFLVLRRGKASRKLNSPPPGQTSPRLRMTAPGSTASYRTFVAAEPILSPHTANGSFSQGQWATGGTYWTCGSSRKGMAIQTEFREFGIG